MQHVFIGREVVRKQHKVPHIQKGLATEMYVSNFEAQKPKYMKHAMQYGIYCY